ncbi:hypothetical protein, partial [Saccharothrix luteola]|uniref:hypothetical protein n=1 Tax=Saccharothrix luteola TaxID=2893018 RepID=UPI001E397F41
GAHRSSHRKQPPAVKSHRHTPSPTAGAVTADRQTRSLLTRKVTLSLELNRLLDELAHRRELERLAKDEYDAALKLAGSGVISREELERLKTAWEVVKIEREQVEQRTTDTKKQFADNPVCKDYPSLRPTPTSTPTTTPSTTPPSTTTMTTMPSTTQSSTHLPILTSTATPVPVR